MEAARVWRARRVLVAVQVKSVWVTAVPRYQTHKAGRYGIEWAGGGAKEASMEASGSRPAGHDAVVVGCLVPEGGRALRALDRLSFSRRRNYSAALRGWCGCWSVVACRSSATIQC